MRKAVAASLKDIYRAVDHVAAAAALDGFEDCVFRSIVNTHSVGS